jgi:hypothetical protein
MDSTRKKKKTLTELAVGGGMMVVFLPLILLAIFWTVVAVGLGLLLIFVLYGNLSTYLPMLLVYGALLAVMIFVSVKFTQRFTMLFRRWRGIRQEQRRVASLSSYRLSTDDDIDSETWLAETDRSDRQQTL